MRIEYRRARIAGPDRSARGDFDANRLTRA
jgi:hypothetical protein